MKIILAIILSQALISCMMAPYQPETTRKSHPVLSELDHIEMLLLNEEQEYEQQRRFASSSERIRIGMETRNVKLNLGNPSAVEIAGNPKYGNERWIYEKEVPTMNGFYKEKKIIYFESGTVVGWETH